MTDKEILKKQIIYRSNHRGTKEMDLLLGGFVKEHIDEFDYNDLLDLKNLLLLEDQILYKWYFENNLSYKILNTKASEMLKKFKL
tara:strand:+ start:2012 stop:2266 length:255 start_codon:yes stop_codon:yes gene_type:complete